MTDASSMRRRYLALWFPFLPTDRRRIAAAESRGKQHDARHEEEAAAPPLALVGKVRGALRLGAVDARARALGIAPRMTLADARALLPELAVDAVDEAGDRHLLQRLARRCGAWTPLVTTLPPDGITLDTTGAGHLFGGEAALTVAVEEAMDAIGVTVRLACASTAEAAQALARHARLPVADERAAIRALPVAALGLEADAGLALRRAGLTTIGDLLARSGASIAARFGPQAVTALRRLTGEERAPIDPLAPPDPLRFARRFAEPIALESTIAACVTALLRAAVDALQQRDLGGRCFVLTLFRSDGAEQRLAIETGRPTRDPALVLRLFDERIGALADPFDPGFGYDSIALCVTVTEPLAATQPGFDGGDGVEAALGELIDRLSTRWGSGSLCRLVPHGSHLPEQAQLALPAIDHRPPAPWPVPPAGEPPARPLFLFDPPQPVEVIAEVPDGPPHRFRWRRTLHEVRLYEGPERIAGEWWRRNEGEQPGKGGLTRDYYRVEDARGRRYWIFRHGLYSEKPAPGQGPKWYIHGLFA